MTARAENICKVTLCGTVFVRGGGKSVKLHIGAHEVASNPGGLSFGSKSMDKGETASYAVFNRGGSGCRERASSRGICRRRRWTRERPRGNQALSLGKSTTKDTILVAQAGAGSQRFIRSRRRCILSW